MPEITKFICPICEQEFFQLDFHEGFSADSCECRNLSIILKKYEAPLKYKHFLSIGYKSEKPIFEHTYYEEEKE